MTRISPELKDKIDSLSAVEQDQIYRYLWHQRVMEDVESHAVDLDVTLSEDDISVAAEYFVYNGDYDCNETYWDNIEGVIRRVNPSAPSYRAINIKWDTDGEDIDLPTEIDIPNSITDLDLISDYITNVTGFCHFGFDITRVNPETSNDKDTNE